MPTLSSANSSQRRYVIKGRGKNFDQESPGDHSVLMINEQIIIIYLPPKIAVSSPGRTTPRTGKKDNQMSITSCCLLFYVTCVLNTVTDELLAYGASVSIHRINGQVLPREHLALLVALDIREEERETKKAECKNDKYNINNL